MIQFIKNMIKGPMSFSKPKNRPADFSGYTTIFKSTSIAMLSGIGEEHLVDLNNNTIGIFIDGNFKRHCVAIDTMNIDTLVGAA